VSGLDLIGRTVIITGASRGIGLAAAQVIPQRPKSTAKRSSDAGELGNRRDVRH
jgi:NAD(P)-dependent dehydrogenase (short-subunit alcohol dehydrogenase family)